MEGSPFRLALDRLTVLRPMTMQIPEPARSLPPSDPTYPFISAIKMGYFTPLSNDRLVAHLVGSVAFFSLTNSWVTLPKVKL